MRFLLNIIIILIIVTNSHTTLAQNSLAEAYEEALFLKENYAYDSARDKFEQICSQIDTEYTMLDSTTHTILAKTNINLGSIAYRQSQLSKALRYYQRALQHSQTINSTKLIGRAHRGIGTTYQLIGETELANQNFEQAVKFANVSNDSLGLSYVLNNIGFIFYYQENYHQAKEFFNESLQLKKKLNQLNSIILGYNNVALCHLKQNRTATAKAYLDSALLLSQEKKQSHNYAIVLSSLAEYNFSLKKYRSALDFYDKSIELHFANGNHSNVSTLYLGKAKVLLDLEKTEKAKQLVLKGYKIAVELQLPRNKVEALKLLTQIFTLQKDWKSAFSSQQEYKNVRDSFHNYTNKNKLFELSIAYRAELQDQKIKKQKKELELSKTRGKAKRTEAALYLGILVALLLMLIFLFWVWRERNKTGKQLELRKKQVEGKKDELAKQIKLLEHKKNINLEYNNKIRTQRDLLEKQKTEIIEQVEIMEYQQTELISSLQYARRIQAVVLGKFTTHNKGLVSDFYAVNPSGILTTSFIWKSKYLEKIVYVIVDSKSEGVMNALASLFVFTQMENWFSRAKRFRAFEIRKFLNTKLHDSMTSFAEKQDLELSIFIIRPQLGQIDFSGNHNLMLYDKKKPNEIKSWHEDKIYQLSSSNICYIPSFSYEKILSMHSKKSNDFLKCINSTKFENQKENFKKLLSKERLAGKADLFTLGIYPTLLQ